MVAGMAGLVAGAMSMAAGEYVSVRSQADTEEADLDQERIELESDDAGERPGAGGDLRSRGLEPDLARQVADQLMAHDALGAHARDELGISETRAARPIQAAFTSAASFALGAALPLLVAALRPPPRLDRRGVRDVARRSSRCSARWPRAWVARDVAKGAMRVTFWGALAMGITAGVGALFGAPTA